MRGPPIVFELLRKTCWRWAGFEPTEIESCNLWSKHSTSKPPGLDVLCKPYMSLSYAWWKKFVFVNFRAFFIVFNYGWNTQHIGPFKVISHLEGKCEPRKPETRFLSYGKSRQHNTYFDILFIFPIKIILGCQILMNVWSQCILFDRDVVGLNSESRAWHHLKRSSFFLSFKYN